MTDEKRIELILDIANVIHDHSTKRDKEVDTLLKSCLDYLKAPMFEVKNGKTRKTQKDQADRSGAED